MHLGQGLFEIRAYLAGVLAQVIYIYRGHIGRYQRSISARL